MKTVLKFLVILFSSLVLAGIFGYWFGKVNDLLLVEIFSVRPGFTTFILSENNRFFLEGFLVSFVFFVSLSSILVMRSTKEKILSVAVGSLWVILLSVSRHVQQLIILLLFILFSYPVSLVFLIIKKAIFAKNK